MVGGEEEIGGLDAAEDAADRDYGASDRQRQEREAKKAARPPKPTKDKHPSSRPGTGHGKRSQHHRPGKRFPKRVDPDASYAADTDPGNGFQIAADRADGAIGLPDRIISAAGSIEQPLLDSSRQI